MLPLAVAILITFVCTISLYRLVTNNGFHSCIKLFTSNSNSNSNSYAKTKCLFNGTDVIVLDVCPHNWVIHTHADITSLPYLYTAPETNQFVTTCSLNDPDRWRYDVPCWYRNSTVDCNTFRTGVQYNSTFDVSFEPPPKYVCDSKLIKITILEVIIMVSLGVVGFTIE